MKKVILFDLDGTLLDTLGDLRSAVNHVMKEHGFPERSLPEVKSFVGNGVGLLIRRSCPKGISEEEYETCLREFKEWYQAHSMEETRPYTGIPELLRELKDRGIGIGTVSNKFEAAVQELCDRMLPGLVDVCVGDKDGCPRKPDPCNVRRAIGQFPGVTDADVLYVGDSETDVETAQNAGLDMIAVTWGFREKEVLVHAGAERFAEDPDQLLRRIILY